MMAISGSGAEFFGATREHRSFRLSGQLITVIEDIACGVEEGEAGLKSCAAADRDASCGVSRGDARTMHQATVIEDEDECFDAIGAALAKGFSFGEVATMVQLGGGATHLLALERWCQLVQLECDAGQDHPVWNGSPIHERRMRCRRAFQALRSEPGGHDAVAVLHIVYGWPDPFVSMLPPDVRLSLGREFAPLARYTDTVEARRQELVRAEALEATRGNVVALLHHRDRIAWCDRAISSGDALRAALSSPRAKTEGETKEDYRERVTDPAMAARAQFLTGVKIDANRMLTQASLAFQDAWMRS